MRRRRAARDSRSRGGIGFPRDDVAGHRRPDIALQHDAFNPIPGGRVPFYPVRKRGSCSTCRWCRRRRSTRRVGAAPAARRDEAWHAEKMRKQGSGVPARAGSSRPSWSPRPACRTPTPSASWSFSAEQTVQAITAQRAGVDVDDAGAVMGASPPQMRGAVLGRLKAEFSLVAMKAGCLRAFEALQGGAGAAVPPSPAAVPPGRGRGAGSLRLRRRPRPQWCRRWRSRRALGRMRACWAVRVRRLPPWLFRGLGCVLSPSGFSRAYLVWLGF